MNIIGYKKVYLTLSVLMVAASIAAIFTFGFRQGIDFVGGTAWQVSFQDEVSASSLNEFLAGQRLENILVRPGTVPGDFSIRTKEISEERHQELASVMRAELGEFEELSFSSIGPAIGKELRDKSLFAFGLVLMGISLYIAFAFRRVSYPVSSWKYGFITLVTLFHDAVIATGFLALLGWWRGAELDTNFIVAILVIMGFSVHDTIVVFDRIRENLTLARAKSDFQEIVNDSVNQTMARSINTSLTLILVLVALYLYGAESLINFTLLILVGTVVGAYSSIFVASPLLTFSKPKS